LPQDALKLPGRIGMTLAPGKCHPGMHFLWQRDLEKDLIRLQQEYSTHLLVTLLEAEEMPKLKIPNLIDRVKAHGMQSCWFPIPDFSTPDSMSELQQLIEKILTAVETEQTVVIHCKGGLGRSGLVAASCLVALGHSPETAFALVRQARPGSVETASQEAYVHQLAKFLPAYTASLN
jgi:protein-tyrosine phosphatase